MMSYEIYGMIPKKIGLTVGQIARYGPLQLPLSEDEVLYALITLARYL